MVRTTTAAYAAGRADTVNAGWIVVPDRAPGLSDQAVAATGGTALLPTTVFRTDPGTSPENRPLTVLGVEPVGFTAANRALTVVAGSLDDLRGDDTVVVTASANRLPSEPYAVVFADGRRCRCGSSPWSPTPPSPATCSCPGRGPAHDRRR
ncbi:hypothetical protein NKG94_28055 [Micromonospora sp. M12]